MSEQLGWDYTDTFGYPTHGTAPIIALVSFAVVGSGYVWYLRIYLSAPDRSWGALIYESSFSSERTAYETAEAWLKRQVDSQVASKAVIVMERPASFEEDDE